MSNVPVARRYARALVQAAPSDAEVILDQLVALAAFFDANQDLEAFFRSPLLNRPDRIAVAEAVVRAVPGMHPLLANLLRVAGARKRFDAIPAIAQQYRDMVDANAGRARAHVQSATVLGAELAVAIRARLEALTHLTILVDSQVNRSMIGGATARVGNTLFDGSLRGQLDAMELQLRRARIDIGAA